MSEERIQALKKQIEELKKRWPAHSVPPAMMAQLDELEEELAKAQKERSEADQGMRTTTS